MIDYLRHSMTEMDEKRKELEKKIADLEKKLEALKISSSDLLKTRQVKFDAVKQKLLALSS